MTFSMDILFFFCFLGFLGYLGMKAAFKKLKETRVWLMTGNNLMEEALPRVSYVLLFFLFWGLLTL